MISIFGMTLLVNIKDTKKYLKKNVLYNMQDYFMQKIVNLKKITLAGFLQSVTHTHTHTHTHHTQHEI